MRVSEVIQKRSRLHASIRRYFFEQSVQEVEVPVIGSATATDPHLCSMEVIDPRSEDPMYLQTSPELFMKRLLCSDSGSIYAICKSFRAGEASKKHNPEFSMLEWYRVGFTLCLLYTSPSPRDS